jgi:hypothetical protein
MPLSSNSFATRPMCMRWAAHSRRGLEAKQQYRPQSFVADAYVTTCSSRSSWDLVGAA